MNIVCRNATFPLVKFRKFEEEKITGTRKNNTRVLDSITEIKYRGIVQHSVFGADTVKNLISRFSLLGTA